MNDPALQARIDRDLERRDAFNAHLYTIEGIADLIDSLAFIFDRVGNERVADELSDYARSLKLSVKAIRDYDSDVLTDRLRDSEASSRSTVAAVFAGAATATPDGEARDSLIGLAKTFAPFDVHGEDNP